MHTATENRSSVPITAAPGVAIDHAAAASRRGNLLRLLVLLAAGMVVHLPALSGDFFWDDYDWVVNNPKVRAPDGLYRLWFTFDQYDYWPMHYSTHWFEWRLWGQWAAPYRVANQAFHALDAVLVWRVLLLLRVPGAWLVALVFAVHPVSVESVAWISQRKTVQSAAGVLASMWCFLRFVETGRWWLYAGALVCFAAGLLTKSSVVMWPCALLIAVWWSRRRLSVRDLVAAAPLFAISLCLGLIGIFSKSTQQGIELARDDSLLSRLAIAGRAVWFYIEKALWPANVCVVYPRWPLERTDPIDFVPLAALILVFGVAFVFRKGAGAPVLAGLGYYVVNLFPALGFTAIMFMRYSLVADHYQYLALPGLLALVLGSATVFVRQRPKLVPLARTAAGIAVALLAAVSLKESRAWRGPDTEFIWRDVIEQNPNSELPHLRLGLVLARQGRFVEAAREVAESAKFALPPVKWNPEVDDLCWREVNGHALANSTFGAEAADVREHFAYGCALYSMRQFPQAAEHFAGCVQHAPRFAAAHYDLALCLSRLGYYEQADAERKVAARLAAEVGLPAP